MTPKTVSVFNIVNKEKMDCPGLMIVDNEGIIRFLNDDGKRILNHRTNIKQGDNVLTTTLAPFFYQERTKSLQGIGNDSPLTLNVEKMNLTEEDDHLWVGTLRDKLEDMVFPMNTDWDVQTERLVQQLSLRYAHEILNALTPVYGILQMLKKDESSDKRSSLIELAQSEIEKGKNYVNDFLNINYPTLPNQTWIRVGDLLKYIQEKIEKQAPEFIPHLSWEILGKKRDEVFVDVNQLRMMIQLLVKKWIDFAKVPSTIHIIFQTDIREQFAVRMNMLDEEGIPFEIDDEFNYYLHLTDRLLRQCNGKLTVKEGLVLEYSMEDVIHQSKVAETGV
ncbi:hypothetical protein [Evansella tamaricis]|uniref:Signal transduction histidine kinase dimerisation/phosphoacceptor domain-containing protein n=1 Tax=Evansella tamaricis TaxID=2069301 RepID=A0ABS6JJ07_9BACI|nr:hypothetical protein [Evansella tamaricis]MBU9713523.1 hypothetical protein [Evansella tamaricis]